MSMLLLAGPALSMIGLIAAPPCGDESGVELPAPAGSYGDDTVIGTLSADGRFGALVALFEAGRVFQGPPGAQEVIGTAAEFADRPGWDHTVFAPTDEAFSQLDQQTIDCMFDGVNATQSVGFHVVQAALLSDDFPDDEVVTIAGRPPMTVDGGDVTFAGADVVETDIEASNGVIHVINAVSVPTVCQS